MLVLRVLLGDEHKSEIMLALPRTLAHLYALRARYRRTPEPANADPAAASQLVPRASRNFSQYSMAARANPAVPILYPMYFS